MPVNSMATTNLGGTLRKPTPPQAAVVQVWLQEIGGTRQSISTDNSVIHYSSPADAGKLRNEADKNFTHFHFLPGIDRVETRWKVRNLTNASKVKFELWTTADDSAAIWSLEKTGEAAVTLLNGDTSGGAGPLGWDQVQILASPKFPDGCPNAANAPYQLRMTVTCKLTGAVTTAWTHFDVLVHSIELHWGLATWIPAGNINNVSALLAAKTNADELQLLRRLKGQSQPLDPEVTAIPAGGILPVYLRSTMAAYGHFNEWFGFAKDFAFLRHKARWGDGPRIPIRAQIYARRMDDSKLDPDVGGGISWAQAGAAMGPLKLLWDWRDRNLERRTRSEAKLNADAGTFVMNALAYKLNTGNEPPECRNCHIDRGGKRGGPDRIFPNQNGGNLPFVVTQGARRKGAAFSTAATQGATACQTGVIFNPSRMARDSYRITVVLANQLTSDRTKPRVDSRRNTKTLLSDNPGLPCAKTCTIEIFRQVDARYIRKHNYTPIDLALIDRSYRVAGLHINWLNNIDPNFTGLWTQVQYDQCVADAIAMQGQHYSDQEILARRYSTNNNDQFDLRVKRYNLIAPFVGRNLLPQFNHWFGCVAGANPLPVNPSEVCFTLPARDRVYAPFLDTAIQTFINKPRTFNGVLRAWNALVNQNPMLALPALRLQYYNGLSVARQLKITTAADQLFVTAGWQYPKQLDANKWAAFNYSHMAGPVDLLAEMHQLKIFADAYEGVSFFHYMNILQTVDAAGQPLPASNAGDPTGRYYSLGGVAKCDTSTDLGLKSTFFVWDHPDDHRRERGLGKNGIMMDGNVTAVHEFGHNLHLTHPFGTEVWNRDMHDKNPAERPGDDDLELQASDQCVMNYHREDTELCGICRLRLRGWAFFKNLPLALEGFDNTNPANPGKNVRASGLPYYNTFFADLG